MKGILAGAVTGLLAVVLVTACDSKGKAGEKCAQHTDCGAGLVCSQDKTCQPAVAEGTAKPASSASSSAAGAAANIPATVPLCETEGPCGPGDFEGCTKTCEEEGKALACRQLWRWYGFDRNTAAQHDEAKTKQYQQKQVELDDAACKKKDACACSRLFDNYAKGYGVERDPKGAVSWGEKACELGEPVACEALGDVYLNGLPVNVGKDPSIAQKHYARAVALRTAGCDKNELVHCARLGSLYVAGAGVKQSAEHGISLARKACNGGEGLGCALLGDWYRQGGPGIKKDPRRARDSYIQACKLGRQDNCKDVKAVEAESPGG